MIQRHCGIRLQEAEPLSGDLPEMQKIVRDPIVQEQFCAHRSELGMLVGARPIWIFKARSHSIDDRRSARSFFFISWKSCSM